MSSFHSLSYLLLYIRICLHYIGQNDCNLESCWARAGAHHTSKPSILSFLSCNARSHHRNTLWRHFCHRSILFLSFDWLDIAPIFQCRFACLHLSLVADGLSNRILTQRGIGLRAARLLLLLLLDALQCTHCVPHGSSCGLSSWRQFLFCARE